MPRIEEGAAARFSICGTLQIEEGRPITSNQRRGGNNHTAARRCRLDSFLAISARIGEFRRYPSCDLDSPSHHRSVFSPPGVSAARTTGAAPPFPDMLNPRPPVGFRMFAVRGLAPSPTRGPPTTHLPGPVDRATFRRAPGAGERNAAAGEARHTTMMAAVDAPIRAEDRRLVAMVLGQKQWMASVLEIGFRRKFRS